MFHQLRAVDAERVLLLRDPASGLEAILVIDDTTLGPAAGGVRTRAYPSAEAALAEVAGLAAAMTLKCALAGLAAGGGKAVVLDHPGLDRPRAFARLGRYLDELGGLFRTAGDLGTTSADLEAMATTCRYVHVEEADLSRAVAEGLLACVETMARRRGVELGSLSIAVQGAGAIGAAVVQVLTRRGARVLVADVNEARAAEVAARTGAEPVSAAEVLASEVDIVAPCALGGVLDRAAIAGLRAWGVCGAANNILAGADAARALSERGIIHVPDVIASAGAVIHGIGRSVMGLADTEELVERLGLTAGVVLDRAEASGEPAEAVARALAAERLAGRRGAGHGR